MSTKEMYILKLSGSKTNHQAEWLHDALVGIALMRKVPIADVYLKVLAQEFIQVKEKKLENDELSFTFSAERSRVVALTLMNIIHHDIMGTDFVIPIQIVETERNRTIERKPIFYEYVNQTITHCKTCNAQVWWVVTPAGKDMPVNFNQPHQNESHFITCPQRAQHRKGK